MFYGKTARKTYISRSGWVAMKAIDGVAAWFHQTRAVLQPGKAKRDGISRRCSGDIGCADLIIPGRVRYVPSLTSTGRASFYQIIRQLRKI